MKNYICPVCGYPGLLEPAYDDTGTPTFDICPCCGCEFGYQDATSLVGKKYRKNWVEKGAPWFQPELKPKNWDLRDQLLLIGIRIEDL